MPILRSKLSFRRNGKRIHILGDWFNPHVRSADPPTSSKTTIPPPRRWQYQVTIQGDHSKDYRKLWQRKVARLDNLKFKALGYDRDLFGKIISVKLYKTDDKAITEVTWTGIDV